MSIVSAPRSHSRAQRNARHRNSRRIYLSRVQPFVETEGRDIEDGAAETAGCPLARPLTTDRILTAERSPRTQKRRKTPNQTEKALGPTRLTITTSYAGLLTLRAHASHCVECHLPRWRSI